MALRQSRVQNANYDAHHLDYHRDNYDGPSVPIDDDERLRPIILAAAGYIPEQAIAFTAQRQAIIVQLSHQERTKLWASRQVRVEWPASVQDFLRQVTFDQDFSYFKNTTIEEFLFTKDEVRRRQLARSFLSHAVHSATEPIGPVYARAYAAELIPQSLAQTVDKFVLGSIGLHRRRKSLYQKLEERLAA